MICVHAIETSLLELKRRREVLMARSLLHDSGPWSSELPRQGESELQQTLLGLDREISFLEDLLGIEPPRVATKPWRTAAPAKPKRPEPRPARVERELELELQAISPPPSI